MRKILCIVLLLMVLTGCVAKPLESTPRETAALPETTTASVPTEETEIPTEPQPEMEYPDPQDMVFVAVTDYIPDIQTELKYSGTDNFTGQVIYSFSTVYLRYGTVEKLAAVQNDLRQLGLGLKIWDGFRPVAAQHKLWEVCPDSRYVANPKTGFSSHSRGNTVDVTLVDAEGKELVMPTGFDDFSAKADRDYGDCSKEAADNALLLETLMEKHGFAGYKAEWWHYSDTDTYPVEELFQPTT